MPNRPDKVISFKFTVPDEDIPKGEALLDEVLQHIEKLGGSVVSRSIEPAAEWSPPSITVKPVQ